MAASPIRALRLAPVVLLLPMLHILMRDGVTAEQPLVAIGSALAVGFVAAWVGGVLASGPWRPRWPAFLDSERACLGIVLAAALAYALALSDLHLRRHHQLETATWDLGIYVNTLWNTSRGDLFACSLLPGGTDLSAHFEPILLLFAPILWLRDGAELLLCAQSLWIGLGAVPLYLLGRRHLDRGPAVALALAYLLHPAIHSTNLFDFHTLALVAPIVFCCLLALERGWTWPYLGALGLLLGTREDLPLVAVGLGLFALTLRGRRALGVATLASALTYFVVVKLWLSDGEETYAMYFRELQLPGHGPVASIALSVLTRPGFVLGHALTTPRMAYLLELSVPLLLLPLGLPRRWPTYAYGLALPLLASNPALFSLHYHYSMLLLPFLFAATPEAVAAAARLPLGFAPETVTAALVSGVLAASAATSARYGVFLPNDEFRGGYWTFDRDPDEASRRRSAAVLEAEALVPPRAVVEVSDRLGPHFAMRPVVRQSKRRQADADWFVLVDLDLESPETGRATSRKLALLEGSDAFERVLDHDGVLVFRRREPAAPAP